MVETIMKKLPLISVAMVNVVLLASYEYLLISLCIVVVLIGVLEILEGGEYEKIRFVLRIAVGMLLLGLYVNLFATGMPI